MGLNVGAILVQAAHGVDPTRVAAAVANYWKGRGAKPDPASPLDLKPLGVSEKKSRKLGVAVAPPSKGWIGVRDSERYFADYSLAKHLSKIGRTCWFVISDAGDSALLQVLENGKVVESAEGDEVAAAIKRLRLPDATLYFDDLRKKQPSGWLLHCFSPVSAAKYDTGPEPAIDEDDEDGIPEPSPKFAGWFERVDKGFMLGDSDWEKVMLLDDPYLPEICRLGQRALAGKENRPSVLSMLAAKAIQGNDLALYKAILDRAPDVKFHPIDTPSLLYSLGAWLSFRVFKNSRIPADWKPSVRRWIKASLLHAKRESRIPDAVAKVKALL